MSEQIEKWAMTMFEKEIARAASALMFLFGFSVEFGILFWIVLQIEEEYS